MPAWPGSLPQSPQIAGFTEQTPDVTLRTAMDAGPDKLRRRFTAAVSPMRYPLVLTKAQIATLDTFYTSELQGGTLPYTHTHPRTGAAINIRFVAPPSYQAFTDDLWTSTLDLEIMP